MLKRADLLNLLAGIRELYQPHDPDQLAQRIARVTRRLIPVTCASYTEIVPRRKRVVAFIDEPEIHRRQADVMSAFKRYLWQHPLVRLFKEQPQHGAAKISDFLSDSEFRRLPLYGEFYHHLRTRYQMVANVPTVAPQLLIGLVVNRWERDFSERDRQILDLLQPHVYAAYLQAMAFGELQAASQKSRAALESLPQGVMVVSCTGLIALTTQKGQRMLERWCKLNGHSSRDPRYLPEQLRQWLSLHAQRASHPDENVIASPAMPLVWRDAEAQLQLSIRAIPNAENHEFTLLLEEHDPGAAIECLCRNGLTRRQAEVLYWVSQGKTNEEVAIIMGVRPSTPKKHLEHIYAKLQVSTRTAAAELAIQCIRSGSSLR